MNGIKCYDSAGVRIKHLYQWDAEQVVKICGVDTDIELEVQFCSIDSTEALVVSHSIDGADIVANVPNILLQRPVPVMVYVCHSPKDGASRTIGAARITVVPKAKPVNYVYTETEVLNYRILDAQMTELRNSIELLEDKIPTKLPNPHPLTINGQSYDGSNPVNISVESNTQGGGAVSSDEIKLAVDSYMSEHPVSFEETDPTVPEWAKQPNKPTYTAEEVGAQPEGDYVLRDELPKIPDTLPNPHKLTVKGAASAEYDGSQPVEVVIPGGGIPIPETAEVGQTIVVKAVDEKGKPTEWEAADLPSGGSAQKKWELLGEYTFTEDTPVWGIALTDLPGYTEFMVYFSGTYTSVATADISFFVNGTRVSGVPSQDNNYKKVHLTLADIWQAMYTNNRNGTLTNVSVETSNYRDDNVTSEPATELRIKNLYGAASFKKGTVVIYGGK